MRPRETPPLTPNSDSIPENHGRPSLLSTLSAMDTSKPNNQSENSTFRGKLYIII